MNKSTKNLLERVALASCQTTVQRLIKSFSNVHFENVPRPHNKHVYSLATLASKLDGLDEKTDVNVIEKILRATEAEYPHRVY